MKMFNPKKIKVTFNFCRTFKTASGENLPLVPISQVDLAPFEKQMKGLKEQVRFGGPSLNDQGITALATIINLGVDVELDDALAGRVRRIKARKEQINPGRPENNFDIYVYVSAFVCPTIAELGKLAVAIMELSKQSWK